MDRLAAVSKPQGPALKSEKIEEDVALASGSVDVGSQDDEVMPGTQSLGAVATAEVWKPRKGGNVI